MDFNKIGVTGKRLLTLKRYTTLDFIHFSTRDSLSGIAHTPQLTAPGYNSYLLQLRDI